MSKELYSVEQVAERLGLHVKTVRNYVREGRLKAVRIGKQYRIAQADLEALTGHPEPPADSIRRERHVEVSSIVEIDAIGPDSANRLTNVLISVASGIRVESIYDAARGRLKIILVGSMEMNVSYLNMMGALLEREL